MGIRLTVVSTWTALHTAPERLSLSVEQTMKLMETCVLFARQLGERETLLFSTWGSAAKTQNLTATTESDAIQFYLALR
uniref:Uncharacterized protein n=1 Tax=Sphaerodactylus townsendi TaxID=933632 RepID=A0ACB8EJ93_9SAUR